MSRRSQYALCLAAVALTAAVYGPAVGAQPTGIDPQATALLKKSMDYLAGLKAFSLDAHSTIEATLTSGQKLQFDSASTLTLQRPNKLVAERGKGDVVTRPTTTTARRSRSTTPTRSITRRSMRPPRWNPRSTSRATRSTWWRRQPTSCTATRTRC